MHSGDIHLSFPSVGATENAVLTAVKAHGTTVIVNAAREPEIVDLCNFLISCGAEIYGAGESVITVKGKKKTKHAVSDWMEIEKQRGISVTSSVMQVICRNILKSMEQNLVIPPLSSI